MINKFSSRIWTTVGGSLLLALAVFLVFSSARADANKRCSGINIQVSGKDEMKMLGEKDIENWVTLNGADLFDGKLLDEIDLKTIEQRVNKAKIVKSCKAFIDLNGQLTIDVELRMPVARILSGSTERDRYVDENGVFFTSFGKHSPTVLLLSGSFFNIRKGLESDANRDILRFVNLISGDDFWNSQIAQIEVGRDKEMILFPFYGENIVEFGKPENTELKLERLLTFYEKILPQKGWDNFKWVSVKYDGQIVCR